MKTRGIWARPLVTKERQRGREQRQAEREKAREVGGSVQAGLSIMRGEDPEAASRAADMEVRRWLRECAARIKEKGDA